VNAVDRVRFEREYYEAVYPDYARQNPIRKLRFYRHVAENVAPPGDVRILDVGCAFGAFLGSLDPSWRRFGADVSEYAIGRAAATVPGATFARGGFPDLPFDGPFDLVTAFDVIEHVPEVTRVGDVVSSRLTSGGHFIFVVPVYDGPTGPVVRLLDKDPTHVHKRSRRFWLTWAEERFQVRAWWGIYRYLLPGLGYLHAPTRLLRHVTPAILVVARKPE